MYITEIFDEEYAPKHIASTTKILDFIHKNCSNWLSQTGNGYKKVYRGMRFSGNKEASIFVKKVRSERKPSDSNNRNQETFNDLLDSIGCIANRKNSVFCTSDYSQARSYGEVFVALPIGDFHYTWSPQWKDFYRTLHSGYFQRLIKRAHGSDEYDDLLATDAFELFYRFFHKDTKLLRQIFICDKNLFNAIKVGHEIMISCDSVLYIAPTMYDKLQEKF